MTKTYPGTCKIKGCGGNIYVIAAALCSKHYNRLRTRGTTDDGPRARRPLSERFWGNVEKRGADECWPWVGSSWTYGYGSIQIGGREGRKHQSNRVVWLLMNGEIPDGMVVRHKCHNRACCNPSHLELGSRADNVQDMWSRPDGAPKGNAKLTEVQVREIRNDDRSCRVLGEIYGVHSAHISSIKRRRTWKHVL